LRVTADLRRNLTSSPLGVVLAFPLRAWMVLRASFVFVALGLRWLVISREFTNFTYQITDRNRLQFCWFVANLTGKSVESIQSFMDELQTDHKLDRALREAARESSKRFVTDVDPRYARRVAWYALVRALKPNIVVETGVDKGLGTMVVAAALLRNQADGHPGKCIALDINPAAGGLIRQPWSEVVDLRIGDSLISLDRIDEAIDLFIHDSDHNYDHEIAELVRVYSRLAPHGLLLSDASSDSDALSDFAQKEGLRFSYLAEEPSGTWMRGQGLGAAFRL